MHENMRAGQAGSILVADFETTTREDDCRVWLWGVADAFAPHKTFTWGKDIESFLSYVSTRVTSTVYFHNLAFDGKFILWRLLTAGYRHVEDDAHKLRNREFTTLISKQGQFYSIRIKWDNGAITEFRDSLKKLPLTVEAIAKTFDAPVIKGDLDYHMERPVGYEATVEELDYLWRDVFIVCVALREQIKMGMTRLTVGSDSIAEYKRGMGGKTFKRIFPILSVSCDADIRRAYRGGFTYADPRFSGSVTPRGGKVYDVNSLYPHVMYSKELPYGEPTFSEELPDSGLFVASITFTARLKPDHIPCISIKKSGAFITSEYVSAVDDPITLSVTNVDLELWREQYDIDILSCNGAWVFSGISGLFKDYIDKWMKVKSESDGGERFIAKLHLNSLYGKFATNPDVTRKVPYLDDDVVRFKKGRDETRDPVYTPVGVFITAYARAITIREAQKHYRDFAYADTDSLHLLIDEHPEHLDVDPDRLGAWKHEYDFDYAIFLRPKAYTEREPDGTYHTHIAGLPVQLARNLRLCDYRDGSEITGKLAPRSVRGGVVLADTTFTIKL